jgi:thioredoxin reductase (NADPH)
LKPTLTVLSREYCHLCEDLITALRQFQGRYDFEIEVIDVDRHPQLEEKWGALVPVLLDGEREICHYFLDVEAVDARLARMK